MSSGSREERRVCWAVWREGSETSSKCCGIVSAQVLVKYFLSEWIILTHACGLEDLGQTWVIVDAGVEDVDAGFEQLHAGTERGDAALKGRRCAGVHDCRMSFRMNLSFNEYRYCIRRIQHSQ